MKKLWLSKDFLSWYVFSGGGEIVERNLYERSYVIWEHSKNLIENATTDLQLSDGIMNLKRCLNQRLQLIEKLYEFKSINIEDKPKSKETLELLQKYGLVRPTIMKTLMYIRNGIEHRDENPPNKERCMEFVDIMWYFLKSTDPIVHIKRSDANFDYYDINGNETQYSCNVEIDYTNSGTLKINGWFPKEFISDIYNEDYFELLVKDMNTKEKWSNYQTLTELALDASPHNNKLELRKCIQSNLYYFKSKYKVIKSDFGKENLIIPLSALQYEFNTFSSKSIKVYYDTWVYEFME